MTTSDEIAETTGEREGSGETLASRFRGLLLGVAVGDSIGLPTEGLDRARTRKFQLERLRQRLLFGRGLVGDDTVQTCSAAQALLRCDGNVDTFVRSPVRVSPSWPVLLRRRDLPWPSSASSALLRPQRSRDISPGADDELPDPCLRSLQGVQVTVELLVWDLAAWISSWCNFLRAWIK